MSHRKVYEPYHPQDERYPQYVLKTKQKVIDTLQGKSFAIIFPAPKLALRKIKIVFKVHVPMSKLCKICGNTERTKYGDPSARGL